MARPSVNFLSGSIPIVCRPALPKDKSAVMALTRNIWEGEDYVPEVWSEWLADPQGLFAVAEYGGSVAGLCKLTELDRNQWWLEGMRVDPNLQRRGIASHMLDYLLDYWRHFGGGTIRLATASARVSVHRMCDRTGFFKIADVTPFSALCNLDSNTKARDFAPVPVLDIEVAERFTKDSETIVLSHGLMDLDWRWGAPSLVLLNLAIEQGQAWWWRDKRGLLIFEQDSDSERELRSVIRLLACNILDIQSCLADILELANSLGSEHVTWFAPIDSNLIPILEAAGFRRDWEESLYIYQKNHPDSA